MGYIYIYIYVIFNVVLMGSSWMFFGLCHVILTLTILLDFNGILLYYHGRSCFMVKIIKKKTELSHGVKHHYKT